MSHRSGIRLSEEGTVFLTGGNGMYSCCLVAGADGCADIGKDGGSSL